MFITYVCYIYIYICVDIYLNFYTFCVNNNGNMIVQSLTLNFAFKYLLLQLLIIYSIFCN